MRTILLRQSLLSACLGLCLVATLSSGMVQAQALSDFINTGFRTNDIAAANLYLVGSTVAHYFLNLSGSQY
ncbi:hypothetical protein [Dictyobacter vulcani]|nr:hypothetical protein [Dictyobacter vulcani]